MEEGLPFTILIVDDDEDDRMIIDDAFSKIGFATEVKKFITGKALLHYLEQIPSSLYPSLIVLDNTLPELDAIDLVTILKNNPGYQNIPVVIYTTLISESKEQQLLSMGVYACYQKGITLAEVVQVARELKRLATERSSKNR